MVEVIWIWLDPNQHPLSPPDDLTDMSENVRNAPPMRSRIYTIGFTQTTAEHFFGSLS
jgi:hypothetical protein